MSEDSRSASPAWRPLSSTRRASPSAETCLRFSSRMVVASQRDWRSMFAGVRGTLSSKSAATLTSWANSGS